MRRISWRAIVAAGAVLLAVATEPAAAADKAPFRTVQNSAYLVVFSGARPVLQYRYDGVPYKPYIKELFTPGGIQVLRDAPADHLHHHGIMFAVAADKVGYWEETPQGGRQVPRELSPAEVTVRAGVSRIAFTHLLDWTPPGATAPILEERRTIEVLEADGLAPTLVSWTTQLTPAPGRQTVELTGAHYYGLGVRLLQSLDRVGRFIYASGEAGQVVRGEERLTRSAWCAYAVPAENSQVTIAVFGHPNDLRHPPTMFTMPVPFAYAAATLNLWKEPLAVEAGRPLTLVYGVALWDGMADRAEIERVYQQWVKECGQPAGADR